MKYEVIVGSDKQVQFRIRRSDGQVIGKAADVPASAIKPKRFTRAQLRRAVRNVITHRADATA